MYQSTETKMQGTDTMLLCIVICLVPVLELEQ